MDILIIKVSTGEVMTHFRTNQNYSEVASMVTACVLRHYPGKSATSYALCDAEEFQLKIDEGKDLDVGNPAGAPLPGGDFDVRQKSAVTTQTIIPPNGMVEGDLLPTDDVVCYE